MEKSKSPFLYERKNAWLHGDRDAYFKFADEYKNFLDMGKTERECVAYAEKSLGAQGFVALDKAVNRPGSKFYASAGGKNLIAGIIGTESFTKGVNLIAAHIDSPRLDLKPLPLEEDSSMALLKTHYYGGIKKYYWLNIPLALHGRVVKGDGTPVDIVIGENESDPVFTINDLLIHLSQKIQGEKKLLEGIEGENLKVLFASIPLDDVEGDKVKAGALALLNSRYGISEEDLISAELEIVPAFKARDIGIDRSMIGGYGQDDRVCSYASLRALVDTGECSRTTIAVLVDKEEIGSCGISGIRSRFLYNTIGDIGELCGITRDAEVRRALWNSFSISADVGAVVNPMYKEAFDVMNTGIIGNGVVIKKYTGARGKSGASDASAEYMGKIREIFNRNGVVWQPSLLGKVDQGGGGTVAHYIAEMGLTVVDSGVGVDGMHSPYEVTSKADLYHAYLGYKAFYKDA